jgi:hypothetical protein
MELVKVTVAIQLNVSSGLAQPTALDGASLLGRFTSDHLHAVKWRLHRCFRELIATDTVRILQYLHIYKGYK